MERDAVLEVELAHLNRKYATLRVLADSRLGPLVASLAEVGQQSPALVVVGEDPRSPILIDGYRRAAALERLGRDTLSALALSLTEADALLLRHRLAADEHRSALEDGWLLRELCDQHGVSQRELSVRLARSPSWVSRRLALVRDLPEALQELVRSGQLPAQAAMKYLVPLSRDNAAAAGRLAVGLNERTWTVREVGAIYTGWRHGDAKQRDAIEAQPALYCSALEEARRPDGRASDTAEEVYDGLARVSRQCWRLREVLDERHRSGAPWPDQGRLGLGFNDAERRFDALREAVSREMNDAR